MKRKNINILLSLILILFAAFSVSYKASAAGEEKEDLTKTITLYTYPSVDNMDLVGTNRGNYHDRQDLGIYMKAGSSFEIRINPSNGLASDLTLDLLNDDSMTEKTYTIKKDGEWLKVEAEYDSVPFIRTLYKQSVNPIIEIRNYETTSALIKYTREMSEDEFFENFRASKDKFAVIEGSSLTMLVPVKNIDNIVNKNGNSYTFKTIDEMLDYYDDFTNMYDKFLGLEYNSSNPLDNNVKTKYFVKANKHGAGAAYYSGNHTAQNGDNISGYLSRGWLNLHEFGHGYQGTIAHQELNLGEVTNNVLGYYYQQTFLTNGDAGWMGNKLNIENSMKERRESVANFNDLNEREKLYVLVNLLDKLGPEETWSRMNKDYRQMRAEGKTISTSDLFAKEFSKEYNVIPYLNANKITVSENVKEEVYERNLPVLSYLADVASTRSENVRSALNLKSHYDLVSPSDIATFNLKGNAKLTFNIDDFNSIKNKKAYIMDGKTIVKEFVITDKIVELKDLPAGSYYIKLPMADGNYTHDYEALTVTNGIEKEKEINYTKVNDNPAASETEISFEGLGNTEFAKLNIDMPIKKLIFKANAVMPHSYFTDEYMNIKVYDTSGNIVYERSFIGNQNLGSINDEINVDYGYKISIKHREAESRLIFNDLLLNEKETNLMTNNRTGYNNYILTKTGLVKEETQNEDNYNNYKERLKKYISNVRSKLTQDEIKDEYSYFKDKMNIKVMINDLTDEDKKVYEDSNKDILGIKDEPKKEEEKNPSKEENNDKKEPTEENENKKDETKIEKKEENKKAKNNENIITKNIKSLLASIKSNINIKKNINTQNETKKETTNEQTKEETKTIEKKTEEKNEKKEKEKTKEENKIEDEKEVKESRKEEMIFGLALILIIVISICVIIM